MPQLYIHRTQGVVTSRIRALCDFTKVFLAPGEKAALTLTVSRPSLCQWDSRMEQVLPPGKIQWFLGDNGQTYLEGEFFLAGETAN